VAFIDSLLRKKHLLRAELARQWHESNAQRDRDAHIAALSEKEHQSAQEYLTQQLFPDGSLCVQRLAAAKIDESRADVLKSRAQTVYRESAAAAQALEQRCTRLSKDIEKLEEKRSERGLAVQANARLAEWFHLDEWVTVRHGTVAAAARESSTDE
jgi:hypothetical protein